MERIDRGARYSCEVISRGENKVSVSCGKVVQHHLEHG